MIVNFIRHSMRDLKKRKKISRTAMIKGDDGGIMPKS